MAESFQIPAQIKPEQILDILIRGKWIIIIPLCISLTVGLYKTLTAEKIYQASTLILVQPQRVPSNYVRSVVTSSIQQRLSTISQQILSRSNLEKIIDQFGLFEGEDSLYLEDKINQMRKKIRVKLERARHGAESFSISYTGEDPQRVMRIANTIASYFMDENLKVREAQAIGTSEFLDSELEKTRRRLEEREQELAVYKAQHLGGLPDELDTNLRTLDRLQSQLSAKNIMLKDARNTLAMIENQIAQTREMGPNTFETFEFEEEQGFSADEQKLLTARKQYEDLLLRYTEKHPDVMKIKKIIEKLEQSIAKEKMLAVEEKKKNVKEISGPDAETTEEETQNFAVIQQEAQLKKVKEEILKIQSDISKIEGQMKIYQQRVEDTPKRSLELQSMQRGYGNIRSIYNSLLSRKLEAEISVSMEKKQKGEQFRILDHARLPQKPIKPDVKTFFFLSVVTGLAIGGGIIVLKELIGFSVIRWPEQVERNLGLPILASIPPMEKPHARLKTRVEIAAFLCCTAYATVFLAFFTTINYHGLDRTLTFIKANLNF